MVTEIVILVLKTAFTCYFLTLPAGVALKNPAKVKPKNHRALSAPIALPEITELDNPSPSGIFVEMSWAELKIDKQLRPDEVGWVGGKQCVPGTPRIPQ